MATPDEKWPTASFEAKFEMLMSSMSEAEQRRAAQNTIHLCLCSRCPTNAAIAEIKGVYCTFGKSDAIQEVKGCLCLGCPITKTMSMRWEYYCMQGSAMDLSDL